MPRFIYVFCEEAKKKLLEADFTLLKEDAKNKLYIFANTGRIPFTDEDYAYLLTDTLVL